MDWRNTLYILGVIITLYACGDDNTKETGTAAKGLTEHNKEVQLKITGFLSASTPSVKVDNNVVTLSDLCVGAYKKDGYPVWSGNLKLTKQGKKLVDLLANSMNYGLDTNNYHVVQMKSTITSFNKQKDPEEKYALLARLDVILTNSWFTFGRHLNEGVLDTSQAVKKENRHRLKTDLLACFNKARKKKKLISALLGLQPKHKEYHQLQKGLTTFLKKKKLNNLKVSVPNFKEDSTKSYKKAGQALINFQYIDSASVGTDSLLLAAVEQFQTDHGLKPDGLIGKNTARAMSRSLRDHYRQAAVTLERWRWESEWSKKRIFVNVPAYHVQIIQEDTIVRQHRIVIGNPNARTPREITSELKYIITYPFWHVPHGISVEELIPKMRKDSSYLARNNYEVRRKGKTVDPASINWSKMNKSTFGYKIRQKGGRGNSLGLIKFIFPNEHYVYLHDTPSKYLFRNDIRAYSHGCLRLQEPLKLAEYLLSTDSNEYTADSLDTLLAHRQRKRINLNTPVPVYVRYISCEADDNGNIVFYKDVYARDEELIAAMFRN